MSMTDSARPKDPRSHAGSSAPAKRLALVLLAILAGVYIAYLSNLYDGPEPLYESGGLLIGRDFVQFWVASDLTLSGDLTGLADPETFETIYEEKVGPVVLDPVLDAEHSYAWYYPPHSLLMLAPLALLPYLWSYGLWIAVTLAAYLTASARRGLAAIEIPALLLAPATFYNFLLGQNGFLSAALLIGGLRLVERRPWLAGVLFGLLTFKPQLGLLVPVALVAGRFWKAFAGASLTVLALIAASAAVLGPESWTTFLGVGFGLQDKLVGGETEAVLELAVSPLMAARNAGLDAMTRNLLYGALLIFVVWGVYATYRNPLADAELRIPVLLAGVMLANPYGHNYDLPLVSVAVLWCFQKGLRDGFLTGELVLLALVWLLPILAVLLNTQGLPPGPPLLLAFFAFVLARANGWLPRAAGPAPRRPAASPG